MDDVASATNSSGSSNSTSVVKKKYCKLTY